MKLNVQNFEFNEKSDMRILFGVPAQPGFGEYLTELFSKYVRLKVGLVRFCVDYTSLTLTRPNGHRQRAYPSMA